MNFSNMDQELEKPVARIDISLEVNRNQPFSFHLLTWRAIELFPRGWAKSQWNRTWFDFFGPRPPAKPMPWRRDSNHLHSKKPSFFHRASSLPKDSL